MEKGGVPSTPPPPFLGRAEVRVWPGLGHGQARAGNRTDREYDGVPRPRAEGLVIREGFGSPCDCLTFGGKLPGRSHRIPLSCPEQTPSPSIPTTSLTQEDTGRDRMPSPRPRGEGNAALRGGQIDICQRKGAQARAWGCGGWASGHTGWATLVKCEHLPVPSPGSCPSGDHTVQGSGSGRAELAYFSQVVKYTSHVAISRWLPPQARPSLPLLPSSLELGPQVRATAEVSWKCSVDSVLPQTASVALSQPGSRARLPLHFITCPHK